MKKNITFTLTCMTLVLGLVLGACSNNSNSSDTAATASSSDMQTGGAQGGTPPDGTPPGGGNGGGPGGGADIPESVTDVAAIIEEVDATADTSACSSDDTTVQIACLANAFKETLTDEQAEEVQYELTEENAEVWSNLPVNAVERNGVMLGSLSEDSLKAFFALAQTALGESGYETFKEVVLADNNLNSVNSGMWSSDYYFVAFLGEPSDTSAWILQIGGHHYASNLSYNTQVTSATPTFTGTEPLTYTSDGGVTYAPLQGRRDAMYGMINSLTDTQLEEAQLSKSFDDVLVGPGEDGAFPTSEGITVSELTDEQQELVKAAIEAWVKDTNDEVSEELLSSYLSAEALSQTKISWSGSTSLDEHGSYVRIDGPRVWIEFICQTGVAYQDQIHYHTVWRDKEADYGGSFSS
ncbi:uncharacterized protein DUF3500 [Paenibacillus cellulosilyticus]|uniref:Uncharacterized protein DUF3500 n=1 Tax=Paenibacillus cellulosilyticus TaxID=375489 RepID=A0A2V2YTC5_9BACL|nr:DUF3500 domain-containing protein [Paenibacillus cellulosilyticus]PWW02738.1 uncharacterized protein DUF3500 [Paenibacillus cellulosilyticus]QKS45665.1 DUF3500 domain-containing protein [Paenibacillus cellulosilyticus]